MAKRGVGSSEQNVPQKRKYVTSFNEEWRIQLPWVKKSSRGESYAFCTACNLHFSVSHGGKNDVSKHSLTNSHKSNLSTTKKTPTLIQMFSSKPDLVTKAEVLFAHFIAEHNLPLSVADHFSELVKEMFPDSETAQKFSCRRTKTTHILNQTLAPYFDQKITSLCKNEKFSLLVDESSDKSDNKSMTILVRVLDRNVKRITTRFLDLPICNIATGASLFTSLNQVFVHTRQFYVEATEKLIQKFPFNDKTLQTLSFVNPDSKDSVQADSVVQLAHRFGVTATDNLTDQYLDYQLSPPEDLPLFEKEKTRLDDFWLQMEKTKLPNGHGRFDLLSKVALCCLSLPHSNAEAERTFSMLRKIQQDSRGNLCQTTKLECFKLKEVADENF